MKLLWHLAALTDGCCLQYILCSIAFMQDLQQLKSMLVRKCRPKSATFKKNGESKLIHNSLRSYLLQKATLVAKQRSLRKLLPGFDQQQG